MNDLNILYSGGSGGFLLLHLLLLSDRYVVKFSRAVDFDYVLEHQWNIKNSNQWKLTEVWPSNRLTHQCTSDLNKIYFYCNPELERNTKEYCDFDVVLYTDYVSQQKLAFYKKANWYSGRPGLKFDGELYKNRVEEYCGQLLYKPIVPFLKTAKVAIKLQDLVNTNGAVLENKLGLPMNDKQHQFINAWKKLHPTELLTDIGIKNET
jgi:hypothetical protein